VGGIRSLVCLKSLSFCVAEVENGGCDKTVMLTMRVRTGYAELPKVVEGFYEIALRNFGSEVELELLLDILVTIYC
jgi:hypothetical protein